MIVNYGIETNSRKSGSVGYRRRLSLCACMIERVNGHEVSSLTQWLSVHAIKDTGPFLRDSKGYSIWQLPTVTSRRHYAARVSDRFTGRWRTLQTSRQIVATDTCCLKQWPCIITWAVYKWLMVTCCIRFEIFKTVKTATGLLRYDTAWLCLVF